MNEYYDLLQLVKASQFPDSPLELSENPDWNAIYEEAKAQAILGIVANEVPKEVVAQISAGERQFSGRRQIIFGIVVQRMN